MKVLFIASNGGDGMLDIVIRAQDAGHQCKYFFPKTTPRDDYIGKGLVTYTDDWRGWMRWADLVILGDNTKYLRDIDAWRKRDGLKVIGASQAAAEWELNRTLGQKVFKKAGIEVAPYREFKDYDQAIAYVKRENRRFVSKPCGDEPDKALSYVAKSPADLVYMLERWKKAQKLKGSFILQEFIGGTEMAVGGWFGSGGFNEGWFENWEFKQLMAGDRGPNTGEMGTVGRYVKKSKLADAVLRPLEDALGDLDYCGYVDVNTIIDDKGQAWPLEFTMRFGWPTFNLQQALLKEKDPVSWLADLSEGRDSRPWLLSKTAVTVVMALPDFPYSKATQKEVVGVPVYGITSNLMENIHPCQMMWGEAPQDLNGKIIHAPMMLTAGDYVLTTTGTGDSVREARTKAYRTLERLKAPSSPFWRPDIGQRLKKQLPEIQAHGYATGMEF
jgi:phosphoribosylamine--glycine ligase